jgi:2-polyprenyl-3-methyl-5-hydroxy-6-metoxy-1,4-benzoquinol methylase
MAVSAIDMQRAEAFGGQIAGTINDALLTLSISVGHRTGLYDALANLDPATSEEIAERTGLQERYVREWLAAQLTGGIVEHDVAADTWRLPPEHALSLTRAAGANNLAILAGAVARLGEVEDQVVQAFHSGGGVPWSKLVRVQEWQSELSRITFPELDPILEFVPGLIDRLRQGIDVVDVGAGRGHASLRMADAYPASRVVGIDQAQSSVEFARAEAERLGIQNVRFELRDAADLEPGAYDFVLALDVIHDLARPYETLSAIRAALRPGGALLMAELAFSSTPEENAPHPFAAALYTVSLFHCMTASLSEHGEGIGIAWGEQAIRAALAEAGFTSLEQHLREGDPLNAYYVAHVD